jgi:twitching motility two-component system response regulator PilG
MGATNNSPSTQIGSSQAASSTGQRCDTGFARSRLRKLRKLRRQAVDAAIAGETDRSRALLLELSELDPGDERVWLWLGYFCETAQEKAQCIRRALEINPENNWSEKRLSETATLSGESLPEWKCVFCGAKSPAGMHRCPTCGKLPGQADVDQRQGDEAVRAQLEALLNTESDVQKEAADSVKAGEETSAQRTVLIVDDSPTVRKIVGVTLERQGARVLAAAGAIEALAKLDETVPDLILLDINMPYMDGYQLCKIVRANKSTHDVPIVMLSGRDGSFDKMRGRMSGANDYITKPFEPATLIDALNKHCGKVAAAKV